MLVPQIFAQPAGRVNGFESSEGRCRPDAVNLSRRLGRVRSSVVWASSSSGGDVAASAGSRRAGGPHPGAAADHGISSRASIRPPTTSLGCVTGRTWSGCKSAALGRVIHGTGEPTRLLETRASCGLPPGDHDREALLEAALAGAGVTSHQHVLLPVAEPRPTVLLLARARALAALPSRSLAAQDHASSSLRRKP